MSKLIRLHPQAPIEFREAVCWDAAVAGLAVPLEDSVFRER